MRFLRLILLWSIGLAMLLGLSAGGLAALGRARWGDAGWYYHPGAEYRLRHAQALLGRGEWDRAEQIAQVLETDGYHDQAALLRAESLFRQAKPFAVADQLPSAAPLLWRAIDECHKIATPGETRLEAVALVGQCYLFLKNRREAEQALAFVLSERPDHVEAHRGLAVLYSDQGALLPALWHLQQVARLDPRDGRPPRLMGLIYRQLMRYPEAIDAYREALDRDLTDQVAQEVREELADCFLKQLDCRQALETLDGCPAEANETGSYQALRAECLWGLGRVAEAKALLDKALADVPESVELLRLRAKLHLDAKEPQAAVTLLLQALDIDPQDTSSRYQLVQAYHLLGRTADVAEQQRLLDEIDKRFKEMTRLSREAMEKPWDEAVRLRLADLCEKLQKHDMAQMWRRAAAACPKPRPAAAQKGERRKGKGES